MPLPLSLILLSIIALVLHILFGYLLPPFVEPNAYRNRAFTAAFVIVLVLIFWFLLPIRIGA